MKNRKAYFGRISRRKNRIILSFSLFFVVSAMISCTKTGSDPKNDGIVYHSLNKEVVLIRDVSVLQQSNDEISNHIDSILNGWIRIYCSQHNDTLRIIDYAYNNTANSLIHAGQKE